MTGLCIGALAALATVYALWLSDRLAYWMLAVLVFLGVPVVMTLAVLPCVLFHIRLQGSAIQRVFLRTRVIDDYPVEDFLDLDCHEIGLLAFLKFRNGEKIPVVGVGWDELHRLSCDIRRARGDGGIAAGP